MPELDFALLAVAATENGEVFNVLGAGVEQIRVARLPIVSLMYVVARWGWDSLDIDAVSTTEVSCRCLEDGALLYKNTFDTSVLMQDAVALPARLMTVLPLNLEQYGRHAVELTVRRRLLKTMMFTVVPVW